MISDLKEKMADLADILAKRRGLEIVDTELSQYKNRRSIRVFIAKAEGVTIEDCSEFSRNLEVMMQAEGLLCDRNYSLEVSSPGMDRPLKTPRDFMRNLNRLMKVTYCINEGEILYFKGILKKIAAGNLEIVNNQDLITIPIHAVIKAKLEVEF